MQWEIETVKNMLKEKAARGQTIRTDFARDRSDVAPTKVMQTGKAAGSKSNISHTIKDGRVPED